jgi:CDP-paratose 2-epimerase
VSALAGNGRVRTEPELGVVEWFEPGEHERVERVAAGLVELGVQHLRTGVSWAGWHAEGGAEWYRWLLERLSRDFELLPCVVYTPPSLGVVAKSSSPPRRPRDYADFIDQLITEHGRHFEHIELWNEPNNIAEWDWRLDLNWEIFGEMISAAAHWARRRGRRTVLGGMSPLDPNWLSLLAARGVLDDIDVIGIHGFPGTWEVFWPGWTASTDAVHEVCERHGIECAIWITEAGFSTWQHDTYAQMRELVTALDAPVERVYWYAAEDLSPEREAIGGFHTDIRHYHMGLRTSDGAPKLLARLWASEGVERVRHTVRLARGARRTAGPVTLVTGGAGFVGTNVANRLVESGKRVVVLDNLSRPGVESNLRWLRSTYGDRIGVEIGDVRDAFALRRALRGATEVVHLAAQVAVTTSLADPLLDHAVNVGGTLNLLEELRRLDEPPPLLYTSTNKVYGALPDLELARNDDRWEPASALVRDAGLSEDRPLDFCTPYGCSKGAADQYVLDYAKSYDLRTVVFRMSCIYGPHQHGNEDQGWVAHFLRHAQARRPLTIYGDGAQVRDVLFVDDLVDAILLAFERIGSAEVCGRAFNIGGGPENTVSLLELLDLVAELDGTRPRVTFAPERAGDQRYYVSDPTRFGEATGWTPTVSVLDGVEALYDWLGTKRGLSELEVIASQ